MAISPSEVPIFILAGGMGSRISEESVVRPKPMVEIGGLPILVHLMRHYYAYGFNDFVICAGYRAFDIKRYFMDYQYNTHDLELDCRNSFGECRPMGMQTSDLERWRVRVIDTGVNTLTGARVARAFDMIQALQPFSTFGLTYGDGLSDVNLQDELFFHQQHGQIGTVLAVKNQARFGELDISDDNRVTGFLEKPESRQGYINGGFFFFKSDFRHYLSADENCILERNPLANLSQDSGLRTFVHPGFWYAMDTLRDRNHLQTLWESDRAPWLICRPRRPEARSEPRKEEPVWV